jgi:hypothetical protein
MKLLANADLAWLNRNACPDCKVPASIVRGPRGGLSVNLACNQCGAEFNAALWDGAFVMGHRNSIPGSPDRARLLGAFRISLPIR